MRARSRSTAWELKSQRCKIASHLAALGVPLGEARHPLRRQPVVLCLREPQSRQLRIQHLSWRDNGVVDDQYASTQPLLKYVARLRTGSWGRIMHRALQSPAATTATLSR